MKSITRRVIFAATAIIMAAVMLIAYVPAALLWARAEEPADPVTEEKQTLEVAVMSDVHILPPDLIKDTDDYADALNSDRKIFTESTAILDRMLAEVEKEQPDVLLISGDLTKDGEYEGHEYLAEKLAETQAAVPGLKVYVTNGNHDVNNSLAYNYNTEDGVAVPATRTTPEKFIEAYDKVVYSDESVIARFTPAEGKTAGMLSYAARPAEGFTVIVVDSGRYSADNTDAGTDEHQTSGQISADLLAWAEEQAAAARERGDVIVGMQHHGLIEHFDMEEEILGDYLVNDYRNVAETYADAGMSVVFTGHMHANDIAYTKTAAGNELYDIETGSAVTYPCPMRFVSIEREADEYGVSASFDVDTVTHLDNITYTTADKQQATIEDLTEYARGFGITASLVENLGTDLVMGYADELIDSVAAAGGLEKYLLGVIDGLLGDTVNVTSTTQLVNLLAGMLPTDSTETFYYDSESGIVFTYSAGVQLTISVKGLAESLSYLLGELDKMIADEEKLASLVGGFISDVTDIVVYDDTNDENDKTLIQFVNDVYQSHLCGADGDLANSEYAYINDVVADIESGAFTDMLLSSVFEKLWSLVSAIADDVSLGGFLGMEGLQKSVAEGKTVHTPIALEGRTPLVKINADGSTGLLNTLFGFLSDLKNTVTADESDANKLVFNADASLSDLLNVKITLAGQVIKDMVSELVLGTPAEGDTPAEEGLITNELKTQITQLLGGIVVSMSADGGYADDNFAGFTVSYPFYRTVTVDTPWGDMTYTVRSGEELTFSVAAAEGWTVTGVTADGTALTATDGKYTVTVTADTNIVVGATAPADPAPSDPEPSDPGEDEKDQGCGGAMTGGVPFIILGALALVAVAYIIVAAVKAKKNNNK